jgi:hypothetical protein
MKRTKTETRTSKPTPCQSSPFGSDVRSVPRAFTEPFSTGWGRELAKRETCLTSETQAQRDSRIFRSCSLSIPKCRMSAKSRALALRVLFDHLLLIGHGPASDLGPVPSAPSVISGLADQLEALQCLEWLIINR